MKRPPLHPLLFEPMLQYRLWGGQALPGLLGLVAKGDGPFGEAWLLSDRKDCASRVAAGPWKGATLPRLIEEFPKAMLGRLAGQFPRFPLLLKFLDVQQMLSVQVHPSDDKTDLLPEGESGKTEAWVVMRAKAGSRIYAGLKPDATADRLRALSTRSADGLLASFSPKPGDSVFIPAGAVHSLGDGVMVFEIQENSDVTFRLYDWDHIDPRTGSKRPLQVEQALAALDFKQDAIAPLAVGAAPPSRQLLFDCGHFRLWRMSGAAPFMAGAADEPRVLVCLEGAAALVHDDDRQTLRAGAVVLLPASVGACEVQPDGPSNLLEIAIPDAA
jgi:mannose-6-phosphate isomerase